MLKNKILMGMLVIVLVFAMTVIGCPKSEVSIEGTWVSVDGTEVLLENGNFEVSQGDIPSFKGTYSVDENVITLVATHLYAPFELDEEYYSLDDLIENIDRIMELSAHYGYAEDFVLGALPFEFQTYVFTFELSDDTLEWMHMGGFSAYTFTRK